MKRRPNPALPTSAARLLEQDKATIATEEAARAASCSTVEARKAAAAAARRCRSEAKRRTAERVSKRRAQLRAEFPRKVDKRAAGRAKLSAAQLRQRSRAGEHTAEQRAQLLEDAAGYVDEADRAPFLWWARRKVATGRGWTADRYEKLAEDFSADRDAIVSRWVSTVEGGADPEWEAGALWNIARDLVDVYPEELGAWLENFRVDDAPGLRRELEGLGLPVGRMLAKERRQIMRRANPSEVNGTWVAPDAMGRGPTVERTAAGYVASYGARGGVGKRTRSPALSSLGAARRWFASEGVVLTSPLKKLGGVVRRKNPGVVERVKAQFKREIPERAPSKLFRQLDAEHDDVIATAAAVRRLAQLHPSATGKATLERAADQLQHAARNIVAGMLGERAR